MTPGGNTPEMDSAEKMRRFYMDEIYNLRAQNARLREALERIAEGKNDSIGINTDIAREALGVKP